jgi:tryptophan-rich hypothetical protein
MTAQTIRRLNPAKLLRSKWTAVAPSNKEKHFIVTRLIAAQPPLGQIEQVELEAIHSRRKLILPWRALTDGSVWLQGWQ